jgi:hypothetical protein
MENIALLLKVKAVRRAFKKIPPETIARIWRETTNRPEIVRLILQYWLGEDRVEIAPRGTYLRLFDYPGLRVSLYDGGAFTGWGRKRTLTGGIITTAALIFGIPVERFPEAVLKVEEALILIENGELKAVELSDEEKRNFVLTFKSEFLPLLVRSGLMTTVARKAPTPTKLWKAIPEVHEILSSPKELLGFFRLSTLFDNETYFRIKIEEYGRGSNRVLLEETK